MTPAEKIAASKPWRKQKPPARPRVWRCLLRQARHDLRLSMDDVAKATGLSKTALWQIETGSDSMLTTAKTLATFFGKSIEELWPERIDHRAEEAEE